MQCGHQSERFSKHFRSRSRSKLWDCSEDRYTSGKLATGWLAWLWGPVSRKERIWPCCSVGGHTRRGERGSRRGAHVRARRAKTGAGAAGRQPGAGAPGQQRAGLQLQQRAAARRWQRPQDALASPLLLCSVSQS